MGARLEEGKARGRRPVRKLRIVEPRGEKDPNQGKRRQNGKEPQILTEWLFIISKLHKTTTTYTPRYNLNKKCAKSI